MRLSVLLFSLSLFASTAIAADPPDHPTPTPPTDRVTRWQIWEMHQDGPVSDPFTYKRVTPEKKWSDAGSCLRDLRKLFLERTAGPKLKQQREVQVPILLNWLAVDPPGWIGCWPTGSPFYVAWEQHLRASPDSGERPFWYRPWRQRPKPGSGGDCLAMIRSLTGMRRVDLLYWYPVHPDPPPDRSKDVGCFPSGFDPEDWKAGPK